MKNQWKSKFFDFQNFWDFRFSLIFHWKFSGFWEKFPTFLLSKISTWGCSNFWPSKNFWFGNSYRPLGIRWASIQQSTLNGTRWWMRSLKCSVLANVDFVSYKQCFFLQNFLTGESIIFCPLPLGLEGWVKQPEILKFL